MDRDRIVELDGLRGVAILMVISFHYLNNQLLDSTYKIGKMLCKITSFGWVGVDLFFVLSGFLIGSLLLRTKNTSNYFSTFYIRRLVRIIPNYYLLLIIFLIINCIPYFLDDYMLSGNYTIPVGSYFLMTHNFYMANLNNMGNGVLSITWSIGIEEQFYLIIPLLIYYLDKKWLVIVLLFTVAGASIIRFHFTHWIPAYVLLPSRMDSISTGVLVALFYSHTKFRSVSLRYRNGIITLLFLNVLLCGYLYFRYGDLGSIKHSLFACFFAGCLVLALVETPLYSRVLRNRYLCLVGTISYSLYLFHYLILAMFHHFAGDRNGLSLNNFRDLIVTSLSLIASFIFSWIIYKWVETPMVRIGKNFKY